MPSWSSIGSLPFSPQGWDHTSAVSYNHRAFLCFSTLCAELSPCRSQNRVPGHDLATVPEWGLFDPRPRKATFAEGTGNDENSWFGGPRPAWPDIQGIFVSLPLRTEP